MPLTQRYSRVKLRKLAAWARADLFHGGPGQGFEHDEKSHAGGGGKGRDEEMIRREGRKLTGASGYRELTDLEKETVTAYRQLLKADDDAFRKREDEIKARKKAAQLKDRREKAKGKSKERIKVELVSSTDKAHKVRDEDGKQFWIQKRWLDADGTVSKDVADKGRGFQEQIKQGIERKREFRESFHPVKVARETEKAIGVEMVFDATNIEKTITKMAWYPKSVLRDGKVPGWMIEERVQRAEEEITRGGNVHGLGLELLDRGIQKVPESEKPAPFSERWIADLFHLPGKHDQDRHAGDDAPLPIAFDPSAHKKAPKPGKVREFLKRKGKAIKDKTMALVEKMEKPLTNAGLSPRAARAAAITAAIFATTPLPAPGLGLISAAGVMGGAFGVAKIQTAVRRIRTRRAAKRGSAPRSGDAPLPVAFEPAGFQGFADHDDMAILDAVLAALKRVPENRHELFLAALVAAHAEGVKDFTEAVEIAREVVEEAR